MNSDWFDNSIRPFLKGYSIECSSFPDGDFGDLERIELEGFNKLGTVEFWSKRWIGIDVYDCSIEDQVMNILLSPEEKGSISRAFEKLIGMLMQDS